jgi:hypothetical protein
MMILRGFQNPTSPSGTVVGGGEEEIWSYNRRGINMPSRM